jgi:hypothetical protein
MAAIQYSAADAGVLVQIADAANGSLQTPPFLPGGWNVLATTSLMGMGSPQAILAGGALPSTGESAVVLACGAQAAAFLAFFTLANHTLSQPIFGGLLPMPPPPPPTLTPQLDVGFQQLYYRLSDWIKNSLTQFAGSCPTLLTCGIGGPGALAQLAAIDFRVGGSRAPSFLKTVGCYAFSAPPFVNATTANVSVQQQLPDVYNNLFALTAANVDFFPTSPTAAMGYSPLGQQIAVTARLPKYDSPWYERSAIYYTNMLTSSMLARRDAEAAKAAQAAAPPPAYDPDLAFVLAQFCAVASEAFQHPALSPFIPANWTLLNTISNNAGQVMAVVYRKLSQVLVAFRGTSSFEETVQTFGNANAQYVNFLAAGVIPTAGQVLKGGYDSYMAMRQQFRQVLSQISDLATVSLLLTGHDTGAWIAVMAATDLMQGTGGTPILPALANPPQLYTFGAPPFGTVPFTNFFATKVTAAAYQVARPGDIVPKIQYFGNLPIGSQVSLPGLTEYDDLTYHPVISYIHLLNPQLATPSKTSA